MPNVNVINITGFIGGAYDFWTGDKTRGTPAASVHDQLKSAGRNADLEIHIGSIGGDLKEAIEIYNALRHHSGKKTVIVDTLAAGAASMIAMAGDVIKMRRSSLLMICEPNYATMIEKDGQFIDPRSELLELRARAIEAYLSRAITMSQNDLEAAMHAETWYTPVDAERVGFCDEIIGSEMADA